jgi:hypothetical protein
MSHNETVGQQRPLQQLLPCPLADMQQQKHFLHFLQAYKDHFPGRFIYLRRNYLWGKCSKKKKRTKKILGCFWADALLCC